MTDEKQASWGKLFGGCVLILLAIAVAGAWIWNVRQQKMYQMQDVRRTVLQPYWDALPGSDFTDVCEHVCTPKRNEEAVPKEIAAKYQAFTKAQGERTSVELMSLTDGGVVGEQVQTRRVGVRMKFAKGREINVVYILERASDKDPWLIATVTTSDSSLEMPTF